MKKCLLPFLIMAISLLSQPLSAQDSADSTELLGLPGDNLDLYAVLTLFQKSKTIEAFEKSLNDEKTGINNLDLNLDKKVDFIKVVTKKDGDAFSFILQVDVAKTETQDVAVILVSKDKKDKVSIQMVGDEDLYGKDYVIEPKGNSSVTANPGYVGADPVTVNVPAQQVTVVQSPPVVQYIYSPAYVPYVPPYYYGFYPPWFGFATVMAVGIYRSNHWGYHGGYYGGHYHGGNNNVIINTGNRNQINHYNNSRNTSNTVANNRKNGSYGTGSANRPTAGTSNRPSAGTSNRPSAGTSNRPSTGSLDRAGAGTSNRASTSSRATTSNRSTMSSRPSSGGGRSMGGGGMRGGGGGRRR
ncbi:hypothetical protein [Pollutibacter soli]|uniref:hypothetical protein n=1 Tax=Pollutibacter soli TaxID=3034157 RepID=UPI00301369D9